jgi:1,4-dihydroxy-6-naphthoate synthase
MKVLTLAYSPDTDDAFMIEPLRLGLVSSLGYKFEFVTAEIQELNDLALKGTYDITAISMAAYPYIQEQYLLMKVGASIGEGWGPAVVVSPDSGIHSIHELKGKKIAVPGAMTSAHFAAKAVLPEFEAHFLPFLEIENAVLSGQVDAGILIHEMQIEVEQHGLKKLNDLGTLWNAKYNLPLPLGANAIKRELGTERIHLLNSVYKASIEYALRHRGTILPRVRDIAHPMMSNSDADRYISMYVNARSLTLDDDVKNGMKVLFGIGEKFGLCSATAVEHNIVS